MRRVDMTGLLERRVAVAVIFVETRLRFQRPSVLDSSATCAAAAVAPRRPRAHGGHHSRCEQAQSSSRPIVCEPSSSTAPTAWERRSHTRKHAHADSAEDSWKSKDGGVSRAVGRPLASKYRVAKGRFRRNRFSENYWFTSVHLHYTDYVQPPNYLGIPIIT